MSWGDPLIIGDTVIGPHGRGTVVELRSYSTIVDFESGGSYEVPTESLTRF